MKAEIAAMEAAPSTAPLSSSVPSGMNGIPAVSDITLITYNLFDNGLPTRRSGRRRGLPYRSRSSP
jgi:hypothetical protein